MTEHDDTAAADPRELVRIHDYRLGVDRTVRRAEAVRLSNEVEVLEGADATGERGLPLPNSAPYHREASTLTGKALDAALDEAGLPKTGTADQKRAALTTHNTPEGVQAS